MSRFLLIDFGASRVKAALFDADDLCLSDVESYSAPGNCLTDNQSYYEIACDDIRNCFQRICLEYRSRKRFDGIFLCSQMHGFAMETLNGHFESNYISWRDQRSLEQIDGLSTFKQVQDEISSVDFQRITGSRLRSLYPFVNLIHIFRKSASQHRCRVLDLCGVITAGSGEPNRIHASMLAGMGAMNLKNGGTEEIDQLMERITGRRVLWGELADETCIAGYWASAGEKIPIFVGVGDHQCSVLGSGNIMNRTLSLNMGTGSQVGVIRDHCLNDAGSKQGGRVDIRPYFENQYLHCVTHIPSGRVLQLFLHLLEDSARMGNGKLNAWKMLAELSEDDFKASLPSFRLGVFEGAWDYDEMGGGISNIRENNLSLKSFMAGLVKSYTSQYQQVVSEIDPEQRISQCILSGGIPHKISVIQSCLHESLHRKVNLSSCFEETLAGLATIALKTVKNRSLPDCSAVIQKRISSNLLIHR